MHEGASVSVIYVVASDHGMMVFGDERAVAGMETWGGGEGRAAR